MWVRAHTIGSCLYVQQLFIMEEQERLQQVWANSYL